VATAGSVMEKHCSGKWETKTDYVVTCTKRQLPTCTRTH